LRVLRLFRFHAWYGKGEPDEAGVEASSAERAGLKTLSGERVQKEMLRLLEARDPAPVLGLMNRRGILAEIFPEGIHQRFDFGRLIGMLRLGNESLLVADPLLRLAALLPDEADQVVALALAWKLSNAARDRLLASTHQTPIPNSDRQARKALYELGAAEFAD